MNTETYLKKYSDFSEKINEITRQRWELKEEYIKSNTEFEIGEKVFIKSDRPNMDRFAFIKSYSVGYNGSIMINLYKCKKDGTKGSHTDWVRSSEVISKVK